MKLQKGFTLIEIMVTVAIVAILASVALPSYSDYVIRGKIPDATSALSARRVQAEQYFQDNRTYADVVGPPAFINPACVADTTGTNFNFAGVCGAATFTITATGKGSMAGFVYMIDQTNLRTSPLVGAPTGWTAHTPDNCWITSKGGRC